MNDVRLADKRPYRHSGRFNFNPQCQQYEHGCRLRTNAIAMQCYYVHILDNDVHCARPHTFPSALALFLTPPGPLNVGLLRTKYSAGEIARHVHRFM